ncbi:MAG: caspase family protein [Mariniblastus sp.]
MDAHSNSFADSELLPPDEKTISQSTGAWRTSPQKSFSSRFRRIRFGIAWFALALFGSTIVWSLTWLRPQEEIRLCLIGTNYANNLSVNHNVSGWNDLNSLAKMANTESSVSQFRVANAPVELRNDTRWAADFDEMNERAIVVYFSAHGAADEQGAYLMPANCDPDSEYRLDVASIIEKLGDLPADKHKLLVLDSSHFRANWQFGILSNDFARSLKDLNQQILDVPNLIVLSATSEDQLAWDCAPHRQTAFGHFLVEGIKGASADYNNNGRIDVEDIYRFTSVNVPRWVKSCYHVSQRPMLLPMGVAGVNRAADFELSEVAHGYQPPKAEAHAPIADHQLKKIWKSYLALKAHPLKPYTYTPARWRQYEQTILRYEQLIRANEIVEAGPFVELIASMGHQLEWDLNRSFSADQGNLFVAKSMSGHSADNALARKVMDELWAAPHGRHAEIWKASKSKINDAKNVGLLRSEILSLLYEQAVTDPVGVLARSGAISEHILDPIEPPPSEINFLRMLNKHLPQDSRSEASAELIRTALKTRLLAEKAAVTFEAGIHANSEAVYPWIAVEIQHADQQRLLGEDLLLAGAAEKQRAMEYFLAARKAYIRALERGARVRDAYHLESELAYHLPYLASWIASISEGEWSENRNQLKSFEALLRETHQLNLLLSQNEPQSIDSPPTATAKNPMPRSLVNQTEVVASAFAAMQTRFDNWWKHQAASQNDIELALSIPTGQADIRMALYSSQANLIRSNSINYDSSEQLDDFSDRMTKDRQSLRKKNESLAKAQVQGRLALAIIGEKVFDQADSVNGDSFIQIKNRINVLSTEEHWWDSMRIAGDEIQQRLRQLLVSNIASPKGNSMPSKVQSLQADIVYSMLGGNGRPAPPTSPITVLRNRRQSTLFSELASRSLNDRWYDVEGAPYFEKATQRYLQTAKRLWKDNPEISKLEKQIGSVGKLEIVFPKRIDLTTESELPFQIGIRGESGKPVPDGFPLLWINQSEELSLTRPVSGEKMVQRLLGGKTPTPEACFLRNPLQTPTQQVSKTQNSKFQLASHSTRNTPIIEVAGFFRGQPLHKTIGVHLHPTPDIFAVESERPTTARFAVKAASNLHGVHGTGSGAVAIVLDASGSMGASADSKFDSTAKYAEATRAIKQVLQSLPDGIKISVWVFGQATGSQKTVRHAEETIKRVVEPTVWNSAASVQLASIMSNISYPHISPLNESPIVQTVLAAKQDLVGEPGFKTVLLVTDGIDNRYQTANTLASGKSISDTLRQSFDNSEISLNVVGFKVKSNEQAKAREQFEIVSSLSPAGKYFEVREAAKLAETLQSVLHQRIRYWVDDYANQALTQGSRVAVEAGLQNSEAVWYPKELTPGSYSLWTNVSPKPFKMLLNRGDQLVVEIDKASGQLVCHRAQILDADFANKPTKTSAGWKAAAMENRIEEAAHQLSLLVGLEKLPTANPSAVEILRPHDIWFEVRESDSENSKHPLTWEVNREFSVPAWRINVPNWKTRGLNNSPATPVVDVWWSPDRLTAPAVSFERGRDYESLSQLKGRSIDVDGIEILIESVGVESRDVESKPGVKESKPCLVVRLKHKSDKKFWVKPTGLKYEGQESRIYESIGGYTGVFWPIVADEVDEIVSGISVYSLSDLKRQAESRGFHIQLNNLQSPRADDVAFPPLIGLTKSDQ